MIFPVTTKSADETKKIGAVLAKEISKEKLRGGPSLLLLDGPLGAGKTQFAQGFIHFFLNKKIPVLSPTYSIVNAYQWGNKSIYHVDLYRLRDVDDLESIGFWDFFEGQNIILVEWAQKLPQIWPKGVPILEIEFRLISENVRMLSLKSQEK